MKSSSSNETESGISDAKFSRSTSGTPSSRRSSSYPLPRYNVGSDDFILVEDIGVRRKVSVKQRINSVIPWVKEKSTSSFHLKNVYRRIPILQWLPKYNTNFAIGDFVAGVTVGLTVIPQSLAYSNIAGLPPQYGLYGSWLGCWLYLVFGSCKDVPFGPTAISSILAYQTLQGLPIEYAPLLCFLCGIIQFMMGVIGLGFLIDFVSGPVSSGFTSAVALIIVTSQIKDILGVKATGTTFPEMAFSLSQNANNYSPPDVILGVVCIVILLLMRLVADVHFGGKDESKREPWHNLVNKTLWLISTSRNAVLVLLCGVFGYYCSHNYFHYIDYIPSGVPSLQLPSLSTTQNGTDINLIGMIQRLGSGLVTIPLVGLLENISICKAFAHGKSVDATQELIAMGLCNIGNSMVQSYPGTGSLSRSAVNNSSGVCTPMGNLYTGLLVIFSLKFLTPWFVYIPKATLAAVIIAAVVFMVEVRVVKPIYRSKKSDLIPGLATFVACLILPLEIGILVGIGLNLVSILYHAARPKISMEIHKSRAGIEYLLITPDRCLIFPSVDYVRNLVTKHSLQKGIPVVIDCSHIYGADFTAAKVIEVLTEDFSRRGQALFFYNLKPSIVSIFSAVQPTDFFTYYDKHELDDMLLHRMTNMQKNQWQKC